MNYQKRFMKYMVDLLNEETHKDRKKKNGPPHRMMREGRS